MTPVREISSATIVSPDAVTLKGIRRADAYTRMATQAAFDALQTAGIARAAGDTSIGVILASRFGPHVTTEAFVDGLIEFGDTSVSPTDFSHSVHNAAVAYIASALDLRGPVTALTGFSDPRASAMTLAACWLAEGRVMYVLVCCAEDDSPMLRDMHAHVPLPGCGDGGIVPGASCVCLTRGECVHVG